MMGFAKAQPILRAEWSRTRVSRRLVSVPILPAAHVRRTSDLLRQVRRIRGWANLRMRLYLAFPSGCLRNPQMRVS